MVGAGPPPAVAGVAAGDLLGLLVRGLEVRGERLRGAVLGCVLGAFLLILIVEHVSPRVGVVEI